MRILYLLTAISALIFAAGCKKDNTNNTNNNNNNTGNTYTIQANIDGQVVKITNCDAQSQGYYTNSNVGVQGYHYIVTGSYFNSDGADSMTGAVIGMSWFFPYSNYPDPDTGAFYPLYKISTSVPFSSANSGNGVRVEFISNSSIIWDTNLDSSAQTGNNFTITSRSPVDSLGRITITGTFNCTLRNASGQSKQVTNGTYQAYELVQ